MPISGDDVRKALRSTGLAGRAICVHASLSSFGEVEGGARAVVDAITAERCTLLVPTFSWSFAVPPPPAQRLARNGWDYETFAGPTAGLGRRYSTRSAEVDREMGAVPAAVLARPDHVRGDHPLNSFSAVGPLADSLVRGQGPLDVYAPLEALCDLSGAIVLMGVGLTSMTLLHLAEKRAGRNLFRRWANDPAGAPEQVEVGGCSDGFDAFGPHLSRIERSTTVGPSRWTIYPAPAALTTATRVIREQPEVTGCRRPDCDRCADAVAGGPILTARL